MSADEFLRPDRNLTRELSKRTRASRHRRKDQVVLASAINAPTRNDLIPELILKTVALDELKAPVSRVRKIIPAQLAEVIESIRWFGQVRPVIITPDHHIIDGAVVCEAARHLGLRKVICTIVPHLVATDHRLLRLVLNRLQEKGGWNLSTVPVEFNYFIEMDVPLERTGFSAQEIDLILLGENEATDSEADKLPKIDSREPAVSRPGDFFRLGRHRLLCADSIVADSYARLFADAPSARAVFTDPPYNIRVNGFAVGAGANQHREFLVGSGEMGDDAFISFLTDFLRGTCRYVIDGGVLFVCMDWRHAEHLQRAARGAELHHLNTIVWSKGNGGLGGIYRSAHEFVFLFKNGVATPLNNVGLGKNGRNRTNVWEYPGANQRGSSANKQAGDHPTPKPVELVADALLDVTARGEVVLDPFAGSGTTFIAAEMRGRTAFGIELDPIYIDLIARRFKAATGIEAIHEPSGKTFTEITQERSQQSNEQEAGEGLQVI